MSSPVAVRIVLVGTETAGNIGSAARAMQTMGLADLVLVAPVCHPQSHEAYWMACMASEVIDRARVVQTLEEALADTVYSIATTRRIRRQKAPFYTPEQAAAELLARQRGADGVLQPVALVFGRESSGLTNPELELCSALSTITAATELQSLNLGQAVMLYCYAIYQASLQPPEREFEWNLATHAELEGFFQHLQATLEEFGVKPATTMENYIARFRRALGRVPLESRDVKLLHNLLKRPPGEGQSREVP